MRYQQISWAISRLAEAARALGSYKAMAALRASLLARTGGTLLATWHREDRFDRSAAYGDSGLSVLRCVARRGTAGRDHHGDPRNAQSFEGRSLSLIVSATCHSCGAANGFLLVLVVLESTPMLLRS